MNVIRSWVVVLAVLTSARFIWEAASFASCQTDECVNGVFWQWNGICYELDPSRAFIERASQGGGTLVAQSPSIGVVKRPLVSCDLDCPNNPTEDQRCYNPGAVDGNWTYAGIVFYCYQGT